MLSKVQTIFLSISIVFAFTIWGVLISLTPPFYPSEAEKKGATPSQYGFVFGIFSLAAFASSPIFAAYGAKIGPKRLYNFATFLIAINGIMFGFLEYIQNTALFLGLSYILRCFGGVYETAAWNSVTSILMALYPDKVASVMSWTQMFFGFGYMIGPAIGSFLYDVGGFPLPFFSTGALAFVIAIMLIFSIPDVQNKNCQKVETSGNKLTMKEIVTSPSILLPYFDAFLCSSGVGMIESMLEPHLKSKAGASQTDVGLTFLIIGGVYMFSSPVCGFICDKIQYPTILSICGNVSMAIAFLFVGPVPFIAIETTLSIIQGTAAVVGFAYASIVVSSFGRSQRAALKLGYADDINTYMAISGMWSASFYLGNFVGPTASGIVVDALGFKFTTAVLFVIFLFNVIVDFSELLYQTKITFKNNQHKYLTIERNHQNEEENSLLVNY